MYHAPALPARRPGAHESVCRPGTWLGFTKDPNGVTTSMCNHHHATAATALECGTTMVADATTDE
jgi:hypothetical protein